MDDGIPYLAGACDAYRAFLGQLRAVASSPATVLLLGESGSGKGQAARALHDLGPHRDGPFVVVSLAATAATLIESELFGHERGAFTDAHRDRPGAFRRADRGTIVLDDVDLLPERAQVALLRVLQERVVEPLGSEESFPIDVRVIATTNADLQDLVRRGAFREDLYYRLSVVPIVVPPLRARIEDLALLAEALIAKLAARLGVPARPLAPDSLAALERHSWPGNVRELENALERVLVLPPRASGTRGSAAPIGPDELDFLEESTRGVVQELARQSLANGATIDTIAHAMMQQALEEHRGNVSAAARQVGLTRRAFEYRLARRPGSETEADDEEDDRRNDVDDGVDGGVDGGGDGASTRAAAGEGGRA